MPDVEEVTMPYTPNWSALDVLHYQQRRAETMRRLQAEKDALKHIEKEAKDAGLPTDIVAVYERRAKDGDAGAILFLQQLLNVFGANGIVGPQGHFSVYTATEEELHLAAIRRAGEDGWNAGKGGLAKDSNPYQPGTEEDRAWEEWWNRGQQAAAYARGGVEPARADKAQPKARRRAKAEATPLPAPEPEPPPPTVEYEPEPEEEFVAQDFVPEPAPRKARARRQLTNGKASPKSMPLKKRGRPPGSKNRPKEARV